MNYSIKEKLQRHWDFLLTKVPKERVIGLFVYGSQNYGLATEESDLDTRALILPEWEDLVVAAAPVSKTLAFENDTISLVDYRSALAQMLKQNPNNLEILFTEYYILNTDYSDIWNILLKIRERLAHYDEDRACQSLMGMIYHHAAHHAKTGDLKSLARIEHYSWMIRSYLQNRSSYKTALEYFYPEAYHKIRRGEMSLDPKVIIYHAKKYIEDYAIEGKDEEVAAELYNIQEKILRRYLRMEILR